MDHFRPIYIFMLVIVLAISACTSKTAAPPPAASPTSLPTSTSVPTETPTSEPTLQPTIFPSPEVTSTQSSGSLQLPIGFAVFAPSGGSAFYYDLHGQPLIELQAAHQGIGPNDQAAVAGPLTGSPTSSIPPLIYYVFENGGELWQTAGESNAVIRAAPNLLNIISAAGKPILSFSLLEYTDAGLLSRVFLSDLQTLPTAEAIFNTTNSQNFAIESIAIAVKDDQPVGLWYTTVPYGIGGNIVFEPRQSLTFLDLTNFQMNTYLDTTKAPVGISIDQSWFAYTQAGGSGPLRIINNFDPSTIVSFSLKEGSNRGAGNAIFSPGNQYVAWKEASDADGNGTLLQTIRIGSLDGTLVSEIQDTALLGASGLEEAGWVVPVAWLDAQTLALEVRNPTGENSSILSAKYDGTGVAYLAPGSFIGLLYP
ncbi:MAG: hypothetical protein FIA98_11460 [Anaerolineae bacterium]|nr:hypothetical protein [Anaerolineae bacterium]